MNSAQVFCAVLAVCGSLSITAAHAAVPRVYTLAATEPAVEDNFGAAVAAAPPYVLVGSPQAEDTLDWAALYDFDTGAHVRTFLNPTTKSEDDHTFGTAVALVGPYAVVGQPGLNSVHVFDAATGALARTITNPAPALAGGFGLRLAAIGLVEVAVGTAGDVVHRVSLNDGALQRTFTSPVPAGDGGGGPIAVIPPDDVVAVMSVPGGRAVHVFSLQGWLRTYADPVPGTGSGFGAALAVLGSNVLVGAPGDGAGAVHVFDSATTLVRTLGNPSDAPGRGFGRAVAATDGLAIVGAPDDEGASSGSGTAWLFDGTTGAVVSEIANPSPEDDVFFGSPIAAIAGRAFITTPGGNSRDHGIVDAFAVGCGNGTVDPGEACDDGNGDSGDDCDANCTETACGNAIVTAGEECDDGNEENEDACTNFCRANVCGDGVLYRHREVCDDGDRDDGDGCDFNCRPSACTGGVGLENVRVTLRNLSDDLGDEAAIVRAHLRLPADDFDPVRDGLSLQVLDAEDPSGFGLNGVLQLTPSGLFGAAIPPGAPGSGCGPQDGWRRVGDTSRFVYRNVSGQWRGSGDVCYPIRARGIVEVVVADRRARGGALKLVLRTRGSTIGVPPEPFHAAAALGANGDAGAAGHCGNWVSERCTGGPGGSTLRCR